MTRRMEIPKTGSMQSTRNSGATSFRDNKDYQRKQEALAAKLKPEATSLDDLRYGKSVKEEQIALAQKYGDTDIIDKLKQELATINKDIERNEAKNSSIFDEEKNNEKS